jgi:AbrB family looped-hinge helix DNA binding protein
MPFIATIDAAGRLVIPKQLRDALRLAPGTRLRVIEKDHGLVLEPVDQEPVLVRRDGLILIGGELHGSAPDTDAVREEWLDAVTEQATGRRT